MSRDLYERYKDALRRGHVAALRERPTDAIAAYEEAAALAPDRPLPHVSRGRVLARLGRGAEALESFERALERAPADEAALAGRADVLAALGRRLEAAEALVLLAEAHDAAGRLTDASDAARRALDLAESRPRRRLVERLAGRLRSTTGDAAAIEAMERALRILERSGPGDTAPSAPADDPSIADAPEIGSVPIEQPVEGRATPDPEALAAAADAGLAAGDPAAARSAALAAARAYRDGGRLDAALDVCLPLLVADPGDMDVHLMLADIYAARGWRGHADDKLRLLGRLADLAGDGPTAAAVRERMPIPAAPDAASGDRAG